MIDDQQKRVTALVNRVPGIALTSLYGLTIIASAFAGYIAGLEIIAVAIADLRYRSAGLRYDSLDPGSR